MGFFDNFFTDEDKGEDKIPLAPVEMPVEIKYHKRVTVIWRNFTEVFDNTTGIVFENKDLFYISFKDEDGNVIRKVYVPMREIIKIDVEKVKS